VRASNAAMATLYRLMEVGDPVYIVEEKQNLASNF
jgi:hypothetical protein